MTTELDRFRTETVLLVSPSGVVLDAAGPEVSAMGVAPSACVDTPVAAWLAAEDHHGVEEAMSAAAEGGTQRLVARLGGPVAGVVELEVRRHPERVDALVVVVRDVSGSAELGVVARLLRRVTELSNDASDPVEASKLAVVDLVETMGWTEGAVLGREELTELRAARDPARHPARDPAADPALAAADRLEAVLTTGPAADDVREGRLARWVAVLAVPVVHEGEAAAVLEAYTQRPVRIDEAFLGLVTEMGRQLGQVEGRRQQLEALEALSEELRRSNAELERFAYIASHDLQEPLRKVIGFSELVQERYGDTLPEEGQRYLVHVVEAAGRLRRLISDLLAYSRVDRRPLQREPVELDEVVARVLEDLEVAVEEAGAEVDIAPLPTVIGDRGRLAELLQNLIGNAIKYRRADERPRVTVDSRALEDGRVEVSVRDNGIGVEEPFREQVFEVFRRLHTRTEYEGSGIGLAICKRIVEQHGGAIRIVGPAEQGTDVRFDLPTVEESTP